MSIESSLHPLLVEDSGSQKSDALSLDASWKVEGVKGKSEIS